MSLQEILDRPIAFHRCFFTITGSIKAALFLSQAVYWSNRTSDPDGWFWKSREQWEDETGLGRREQEYARKILKDVGLIEEMERRIEHKVFYRVNSEVIESSLLKIQKPPSGDGGNRPPGMAETALREGAKPPSVKGTETTSETTSETESGNIEEEQNLQLEKPVLDWCKDTWGKKRRMKRLGLFKVNFPDQWERVEQAMGPEEFRRAWLANLDAEETKKPVDFIREAAAEAPVLHSGGMAKAGPRRGGRAPEQTDEEAAEELKRELGR